MDSSKSHQSSIGIKYSTNLGNSRKLDQKDAMLGKKRSRQTMFLDVDEAAKRAPVPETATPKISLRGFRDTCKKSAPIDPNIKDTGNSNTSDDTINGSRVIASISETKSNAIPPSDVGSTHDSFPSQNSRKQDGEIKAKDSQLVNPLAVKYTAAKMTGKKNPINSWKNVENSQKFSIERLHREATSDKLWKPDG
mgnify:FL=1